MKLFTKRHGITINLSTEAIIRALVLIVVTVFVLRFIGKVGHQLELFGVSAFLALALNPAVSALSRHLRIKSRVWATGLAYIVVVLILSAFLLLIVPPLLHQTRTFVHNIPATVNTLKDQDSSAGRLIQRYHLQPQVDKVTVQLTNKLSDAPGVVISAAGTVGSVVVSVITIVVLTFMMLVEGPLWAKRAYVLAPEDKRDTYKDLALKMYRVITGYVNGQVLIAALASFMSFVVLTIASHFTHVSVNTAALACIVFLFGLIPLIGNTIAAVIVVIICAFSSIPLAIVMAIYFPIYQQTENATLQPHIQAKNNQLTPLLVFMAALLGAGFGGLLGAFVAIPTAGCLRILFEHHFGDRLAPTAEKVAKSKN